MDKLILSSIQEIFLFDLVEMAMLLYFYIIGAKVKIGKVQFIYNLGLLTIFDFVISALNLPVIMQIVFIIIVAIYLKEFFHVTIKQNVIILIKYSILMSIEILYAIVFKTIFDFQLIAMQNNLLKFYYVIPCKVIEGLLLYLYYKNSKRR